MSRKKISLIGGGNIGSTIANLISIKGYADVVLFDLNENMAKGKALDLSQSTYISKNDVSIIGTNNYEDIKNSDVIIVTAGVPRKPGMSRDDLVEINTKVMVEVGKNIAKYSPNAFIICVTNPLDVMVWALQKSSGVPHAKLVGMAGILDSARFAYFLSQELNISVASINTVVLGGHGDTMVPLLNHSTVGGISLNELVKMGKISQSKLDEIVIRTRNGGGEIVNLLGNGSAYFSPAASALQMAESYLFDKKQVLPIAAYVNNGEYGLKDIYVGVTGIIGANGCEKIIELNIDETERKNLDVSINSVKELIEVAKKFF
jgi:malate dehydrogenase